MKFGKKFFIVLGLVVLLASLLATSAFAPPPTLSFAKVDRYQVTLTNPPYTWLNLSGGVECNNTIVSSSELKGQAIYLTIQEVKSADVCFSPALKPYTATFAFKGLSGGYTVYQNDKGSSVGGIQSFQILVPPFDSRVGPKTLPKR
jgi:hypothetical protein